MSNFYAAIPGFGGLGTGGTGAQGPKGDKGDKGDTGASGAVALPTMTAASDVSGHRALMAVGGGVAHADPSSAAYNFVGISSGAAAAGASVTLAEAGSMVTEPSWSWTTGRPVFVAAAGTLTHTPPTTGVLHQIGQAVRSNTILVQPFLPITRV